MCCRFAPQSRHCELCPGGKMPHSHITPSSFSNCAEKKKTTILPE